MPDAAQNSDQCSCTDAGEDIWCRTHGANAVLDRLRAENKALRDALTEIDRRCDHVDRDRREPDKTLLHAASIRGVVIRSGALDETGGTK